ncbi:inorganic pyrophosphatase [Flavobacteriales bacterium]|jgi:inorganic pyrophosphatase|nr:inorganic pyrophosphatase [Flavobacteriales bacterium]
MNMYQAHPWHGIKADSNSGDVHAFIEIVPSDTVKYEVDKESGYLMIDRPQKFSNIVPALYGFVPQTYCYKEVGSYCSEMTGREGIVGDEDPLDICVLTERDVTHGNILVNAKVIGGFRMIDGGEADDKIIAVLAEDQIYNYDDISEVPGALLKRLKHYFLTYKIDPSKMDEKPDIEIAATYGRDEALEVIKRSKVDYATNYTK